MTAVPYIWIPGIAVLFYLYLLIAFCSAKKNSMIRAFMRYLIVLIMWTGGSTLMRLSFWPGYVFWYQVSFLTLLALPWAVYDFVTHYLGGRLDRTGRYIYGAMVIYLFLALKQVFLAVPRKMVTPEGRTIFHYDADWRIVIPLAVTVLVLGYVTMLLLRSLREQRKRHKRDYYTSEIILIMSGCVIMILGNVLSVMPGNIFPFDTLAGIVNAVLLFAALAKRRAFRLTTLYSSTVIMFGTVCLSTVIMSIVVGSIKDEIDHFIPNDRMSLAVTGIVFTIAVFLVSLAAYCAIRRITLRKEQASNDRFREFSQDISRSLDVQKIMDQTFGILRDTIKASQVSFFLLDRDSGKYVLDYASNPLDKRDLCIESDAPYIDYIAKGDTCLMFSDFKRSVAYRSMWSEEKTMLESLGVECITALRNNDELIGILLIGKKVGGGAYSYDDKVMIGSVQSVASIALNNAILYGEAERRADLDPQLDMFNRAAFLRKMEEEIGRSGGDQLSYLVIDIDDLRLYNELYGTAEGDKVLSRLARIIKNTIPRGVFCGRVSDKEFGICMPHRSQMEALRLAENIKSQLERSGLDDDGIKRKNVTFTAGICSMPYGATTMKELQTNVSMEIHHGKRLGKNRIMTYHTGDIDPSQEISLRKSASAGEERETAADAPVTDKIGYTREYEEVAPTIYALTAAIDAKDHFTFSHSRNVAICATLLARRLGVSREHQELIYEAGLLHDIGKIAIPERILTKPGKLTDDEYAVMKTHVNHSIEIIRHLPNLDYLIPAVVGHHERWDGRGYPNGLAGTDISVGARCLAIADAFDAMISRRSYKDPLPIEYAAQEILRNAGSQFDPDLARTFVELINEGVVHRDMEDLV